MDGVPFSNSLHNTYALPKSTLLARCTSNCSAALVSFSAFKYSVHRARFGLLRQLTSLQYFFSCIKKCRTWRQQHENADGRTFSEISASRHSEFVLCSS
eukprot:s675_g43.t1